MSVTLIDTTEMNRLIGQFVSLFPRTASTPGLWICGRIDKFGFRPSFERDHLEKVLTDWIKNLNEWKVMVTPVIFYHCKSSDHDQEEKKEKNTGKFFVKNHYNMLISWIDATGNIKIERYEPADTSTQGILDDKMEDLLIKSFKRFSRRKISYYLVSDRGLQYTSKDDTLCGYHILYWLLYRLKYGLDKAIKMLHDGLNMPMFREFCKSLSIRKAIVL